MARILRISVSIYRQRPGTPEPRTTGSPHYAFAHVDINDRDAVDAVFKEHEPDVVVHFAAESHADRSIEGPRGFLETKVWGTLNFLEATRICGVMARASFTT